MPKKKQPTEKNDQDMTQGEHYNAILLEDIRSTMKFVVEKVESLEESLTQKMDERFARQDEKFEDIHTLLRIHSKKLGEHDKRWEQNDKRWDKNDATLQRIETKLDQLVDKVEEHDQDIKELKSAVLNH